MNLKTPTRTIVIAVAATLAAALLLPFAVNVNRFRGQIVRALEAGLGRPVQAGNIRLRLLSWPGFDLQNVVIAEDPAFGIEPFVRMPTLRATLRLRSLWTGRMVFSSLVFVEPSVNLARNAEGRWALEALLARAAVGSRALAAAPPYLELKDARVNFKSGNAKSIFFLSDVDAALYSGLARFGRARFGQGEPRQLYLRLSCSPARTDRTLTDVGRLQAQGTFVPAAGGSDVRLQINLADAYLADLLMLASGADRGVHGVLNVSATLEGKASNLRVNGAARLADLHRWDMLPPQGSPAIDLRFQALLDAPAGRLQMPRLQTPLNAGMLEGSGTVSELWEHPQFEFRANFSGARAAPALAAVQHFSSRLSPTARLEGALEGEVRLRGMPPRIEGFIAGQALELHDAGLPGVHIGEARLEMDGSRAELLPVTLGLEGGRTLQLAGRWNWETGSAGLNVSGRDLPLRSISALLAIAGADLPASTRLVPEGRVSLVLHGEFEPSAPMRLIGGCQLARVPWAPSPAAPRVLLHTARLDFLGEQARASRIVASWAGATITGAVRIPLRKPAIYHAELRADEWTAAALASALGPSRRGMLPLLGGSGAGGASSGADEQPRFRAEGRIAVGRLRLRRLELENVDAEFRLAGRRLQLEQARASFAGGTWTGGASIDFSAASPAYQVNGRIRDAALAKLAALSPKLEGMAAGQASGSVMIASSGWELAEILDNLTMRLRLQGRDLVLQNVDLESAAGAASSAGPSRITTFTADVAVERRRVRLQDAVFHGTSSAYKLSGAVGFDRVVDVSVAPVGRNSLNPFRLTGPLDAPNVEPVQGSRFKVQGEKPPAPSER